MSKKLNIKDSSHSVQAHLTLLQTIIQRMAGNSASSKTWCITLVSAILVIVVDKGRSQYIWIAIMPIFIFCILDAYYLAQEKCFRNSYNSFIDKLHKQVLTTSDLFVISPKGSIFILFLKSLISFSVWPFYFMLLGIIFVIKTFIV